MGIYRQILTFLSLEYEHEMIKKAEATMLENLLIKAIEEEGVKDGKAYYIETQTSVRVDPDDGLNRLIKGLRMEEIVRCKDCKWSEDAGWACRYFKENGMLECKCQQIEEISDPYEGSIKVYKPTDFCSYGERKDNIT